MRIIADFHTSTSQGKHWEVNIVFVLLEVKTVILGLVLLLLLFCMYVSVCVCVCVQHLFALEAHGDLVKCIMEAAAAYVGIAIRQRKEPITYEQFLTNRMGKYRSGWLLLELD